MTNENLILIASLAMLAAAVTWWAFAYRNFREARANEKLFFKSLSRQLHNHTVIQLDQERRAEEREVELAKSRLGVRGEPTGLEGAPILASEPNRDYARSVERLALLQESDREANIKAENDRLRAALDLIPANERRDTMKFRRESEARKLIAKTDLATLERAISEREPIPEIAPTIVAKLAESEARIAAANASKAEAEARLAVAMAPPEKPSHSERVVSVLAAAKAVRDAKDGSD